MVGMATCYGSLEAATRILGSVMGLEPGHELLPMADYPPRCHTHALCGKACHVRQANHDDPTVPPPCVVAADTLCVLS